MEQKDYSELLQKHPTAALIPWLEKRGELKQSFLIYKNMWGVNPVTGKKDRMEQVKCSSCGGETWARQVIDPRYRGGGIVNIKTKETINYCCPICHAPGRLIHSSQLTRLSRTVHSYPITVERVEENLVIYCWCVEKSCYKNGKTETIPYPYEAYVVEEKKIVRLNGWAGCMGSDNRRLTGRWTQRKKLVDYLGRADLVYPWDPDILIGSTAEKSKLDLFMEGASPFNPRHPVQYLKLWLKQANIENLVMQGASYLVDEIVSETKRDKIKTLNLKANRPSQILGLDKPEFQQMVEEQWRYKKLRIFRLLKDNKLPHNQENFALCEKLGEEACENLLAKGLNPVKTANYLKKQKEKDSRNDYRILKDYWNMAETVGLDLKNPKVLYPVRLYSAHNRVMVLVQEIKVRVSEEKMEKRFKALDKFSWEHDGISIRPAMSSEELKIEGELLNHCIYSYASSMERGTTAIFLIRKTENPDIPWYTLEFDEKNLKVKQNRGYDNKPRTKEVAEFEKTWLEHIQSLEKEKNKKTKATQHKKRGAA